MLSHCQVFFIWVLAMLVRSKSSDVSSEAMTCTTSTDGVTQCLLSYIDSVGNDSQLFNFGVYATLTRDNAVRPEALAQLSNLVMPLLIRNPSARFQETEFKNGVAAALALRPDRIVPTTKSLPELCKFVWTQVLHQF